MDSTSATDIDSPAHGGSISYSIESDSTGGHFDIDHITGRVYVAQPLCADDAYSVNLALKAIYQPIGKREHL